MGPIQTLEDLIGMIWRRRVLILIVTLLGTLLAAVYAKSRPDIYEAAAVIQVELPAVIQGGQAVAQTINPLQVMQTIEQRLTTRDMMLALIDRHGLQAEFDGLSLEERVAAIRSAIQFQSVSNATGGGLSAILITARAATAAHAARIANDLAQSVLDMGAQGKKASADANFAFFKQEEGRVWEQLTNLEREVAAYREENRDVLPASREARQDEITALKNDLRALDQEIAGLQNEEGRLRAAQVSRATDRRRLDDIVQRLEILTAQRGPLEARQQVLEASLVRAPEVDRALSGYERQLRQLQDQYTVVSQRLAEAETARRLAENQQTERFSMLERAIEPEYPLGSGGKKLVVAGGLGSIGLALALAFLLEAMHPAIRTSAQMRRELNITPIVAIPEVTRADFPSLTAKGAGRNA
jgi:uncharacterized protein involved in exopolysaccharide biosynthesis